MENRKVSGADVPRNIRFYTYTKLMNMSDAEMAEIQPGMAVYDEFHRVGAQKWSTGGTRLRAMYPTIPVLGLSATAVRYLDNQRDMAEELFDGYAASAYHAEHGDLNVPKRYVADGLSLGSWITT